VLDRLPVPLIILPVHFTVAPLARSVAAFVVGLDFESLVSVVSECPGRNQDSGRKKKGHILYTDAPCVFKRVGIPSLFIPPALSSRFSVVEVIDCAVGAIGKDLPGFKLPLTPAGEAALQPNLTATIDPESLCIIGGIPRDNASGLPFMVLQNDRFVAFLHFYSYYRLIRLDGRKHYDDRDPSFFGEEIGHWDGDTLVVDSIGFKDEKVWIDENANPHSDALHVVERWCRGSDQCKASGLIVNISARKPSVSG